MAIDIEASNITNGNGVKKANAVATWKPPHRSASWRVLIHPRALTRDGRRSRPIIPRQLVFPNRETVSNCTWQSSVPVEYIMYDLWESMRAQDKAPADDILVPVFTFIHEIANRPGEKEIKASQSLQEEGAVLCWAVKVLADEETGLDVSSSKRVLRSMIREWEMGV
ncbi:hypothetical protein K504DRAFT_505127 [Pleomassaria siparia CBS 279.74]|uniref:Uncharacterized protein n=1 Tax=Pleomassaria siparia CBS 279.74 TaxID=1314801 RepID=A0A6G1JZY2_9PLEO|nr:hypothetical protein K504DRAFT_505127 [Pleomassaria siparia CBS 279.74]